MKLEYNVTKVGNNDNNDKLLLIDKEWISERTQKLPIELTIVPLKKAEIEKIEIVVHNKYIPKKISIYSVDDAQEAPEKHFIGDVEFSKRNEHEEAYEMKNIFLDEKCSQLILKIHLPHLDIIENLDSLVGVISVKLFGKYLVNEDNRETSVINEVAENKYSNELKKMIEAIERNKQIAVANEDFGTAKSAQITVRQLQKSLKQIEELEKDKQRAINDEDYGRAHELQDEIRSFRSNILVNIDGQLLDDQISSTDEIHRPKNLFGENGELPADRPKLFEPIQLSPTEVPADPAHTFLPPPAPKKPTTPKKRKPMSWEVTHSRPSTTGSVQSRKSTASSVRSNAKRRSSSSSQRLVPINNKFMEKENMIVPAALGRHRSSSIASQPNLVSDVNRNVSHINEDTLLSTISPDNRANVRSAVNLFGLETIAKLYSKHFENRKEAIYEIHEKLDEFSPSTCLSYFESINCLVAHILKEPLYNVYRDSLNLWHHVCTNWIETKNLNRQMSRISTESFETISSRVLSNDKRTSTDTIKAFTSVITKSDNAAKTYSKDLLNSNSKNLKGRSILFEQIAKVHGIPNDKIGLNDSTVALFATKCIRHNDQQVRSIGHFLMVQLYKNGSTQAVRSQLNHFAAKDANNPTYQKIVREIIRIDGPKEKKNKKRISFAV